MKTRKYFEEIVQRCDDCTWLTEAFEETTLCAECQVEESRTGRHWEQSD